MKYLFVTRKNVHAKYYKTLIKRLGLQCELFLYGWPKLSALLHLQSAVSADFGAVIESQLKRKQASSSLWGHAFVKRVYTLVLSVFERLRYAKALAVLSEKKPDCLVLWNGLKLPNVTYDMAAKSLGIKVFHFENGLLPNTVTLDSQGVNFLASLSRDPRFYLEFDPNDKLEFSIPSINPRAAVKKRQSFQPTTLPERFIFVPFQVPHDTQIVCQSPWIESMEMLYDEVVKAVRKLNDPSLKVVFKEHPNWPKHYSNLYNKDDIALFANGNDTVELIQQSQAVITINSTVGMEALLLGKTVITLGNACYNIDALVLHAANQSQLLAQLREVNQGWLPNSLLTRKFFTYLKHVYCIPRVRKDDEEHIIAVEKRLTEQDAFSRYVPSIQFPVSRLSKKQQYIVKNVLQRQN